MLFESLAHGALSPAHANRAGGQVLLAINLGLTIADAQLLFGHSEVTIRLWLTRAGQHTDKMHAHFFRDLHLGHLQLDELYTTLRDKTHDLWVWVAFDPDAKLIPALRLGPRTQHMAFALLHAVRLVLAPGCLWGRRAARCILTDVRLRSAPPELGGQLIAAPSSPVKSFLGRSFLFWPSCSKSRCESFTRSSTSILTLT